MLFQAGFWKDYAAAIVITVVLGAALAAGVAGGLDAAFGQVLGDVFGAPDEFGLIVHVRAESAGSAAAQISQLLADYDESIVARRGVTVAGNANFLVTIPDHLLATELLEQLPVTLQQLSGFNGHTWLLEPSVTVSGMRPAVRDIVAAQVGAIPGVRAVVRQGSGVTVVVWDSSAQTAVAERLEGWLDTRQVVEIHLPDDADVGVVQSVVVALDDALQSHSWRVLNGDGGTGDERLDALVAGLEHLPRAWQQVSAAGSATAEAIAQLAALLDSLQPALALAEQPDQQAERLARSLREGDGAGAVKDVLVNVATTMLLQSLTGTPAKAASGDELAHGVTGVAPGEVVGGSDADDTGDGSPTPLQQLQQLHDALEAISGNVHALAALSEPDLDLAMAALEQFVPSAGGPERLELLVDTAVSTDDIEHVVDTVLRPRVDVLTGGPSVFVSVPGVVNPNPRTLVADLLVDVRRAIAGLLAFLLAAFALVFDHAGVFAALRQFDVPRGQARVFAAGIGTVLFGVTYLLAGGGVPVLGAATLLDVGVIVVLGAFMGLLTLRLAPRLSPVDGAEVLAGRSLGLNDGQVMREIVVPAGRPGVLAFINRHRRRFL